MSNQRLIYDILKGKNTLAPELDKAKKKSSLLDTSISKIGGSFLNLRNAAGIGIAGFGLVKAIGVAQELENALIGLSTVARNTGTSVSFITDAAKDLAKDGLIPLQDVSASLKNLLAKGFSGDEAIKVFKGLRESAAFNRQGQLDLGEAIRGATEGLKNDLSVKVDNAGITKNLSIIQKEYAAQIGKTVGRLTEAEKRQAFLVVGLKEAAVFQGDYNKLVGTFSGASSRAGTSLKFLVGEIGSFITRTPEAREFLNVMSGGFERLSATLKGLDTTELGKVIDFLLVTPAKFWVDFFGSGEPSNNLADIDSSLADLNKQLALAEKNLRNASKEGDGVQAGFFGGLLGGFDKAQTQAGGLNSEIGKLIVARRKLFAEGGSSFVGPSQEGASVSRRPEVDQAVLTAKRKQEEELLAIAREFAILSEEERLANNLFTSETEQAEFEELVAKVGERNAQKLLAQKNLADGEVALRKNELAVQKAFLNQKFKNEQDAEKAKIDLQKKTVAQEKLINQTRLSATNNFLQAGITLSKQGSAAQKALLTTQAIVNTYAAANNALATPAPYPLPAIFAASTVALGLANVAKINGAGFQQGGVLQGGTSSGDQTTFRGNAGEVVLNKSQQGELLNIARGRDQASSNAGGQTVDIKIEIEGNQIARVIRNLQTDGFLR